MLEEKNDNLSVETNETDGSVENGSQEVIQTEAHEVEEVTTEPIAAEAIQVAEEVTETNDAITAIENENAAENEDETLKERHEIPMLDYESLSMEELIAELEKLSSVEKIMSVN
jgi:hypothetical protein